MSFVIDPTSISQSKILEDLRTFVDGRPDADAWQLFFDSGVGSTVLKILGGMEAYNTYNNIVGRREAYVQYAQNRSSVVGGAQYLGYSAFRGSNPIVTLTITPNFTGTIQKFSIVGAVKSQELIALETKVVNAGIPAVIKCVVGDLKTETLLATSNAAALFRFTGNGTISDTLRVLVDGDEVETSDRILDLDEYKFVVQTNAVGSVDIFSTNEISAPIRYDTNSEVTIEWIELKQTEFANVDFSFLYGVIDVIVTDSGYLAPQEMEQIRIKSRLQNEVQFVIRAREDQPKQLLQLDDSITDAKGEDVSAAIMRLFYLRDGELLFDETEKAALVTAYERFRPHAMAPPLIADPTRIPLKLKVDATLHDASGDPENDIRAITQAYAYKLKGTISLDDLEQDIEALQNIKIARPSFTGDAWVNATKYEKGQHVVSFPDNGRIYQLGAILYFSDALEPVWPIATAGETIIDGDIIWKSIPKNDTAGINTWLATTSYQVGSQVKPSVANGYIFEAFELINKSAAIEPVWSPLTGQSPLQIQGTKTNDGDIMWAARPLIGTPTTWTASTKYKKGDTVVATNPTTSDTIGVMFQAFAYLGTSDAIQPVWPTTLNLTIVDNNIQWICQNPLQNTLEVGIGEYLTIEEDITVA